MTDPKDLMEDEGKEKEKKEIEIGELELQLSKVQQCPGIARGLQKFN